jgi:hypothetical protein
MTDFNFFAPNAEDIKEAGAGGGPTFTNGEVVGFLINEVNEKVDDKGEKLLVVGCQVLTGDNEGKKFSHWIRNNKTSKGIWINMLRAFFDEATMTSGSLTPGSLVGKKMTSPCVINKSGGKEYANFYQFKAEGGVPNLGSTPAVNSSDIPF